jgi:hypothetical protein
MPKKYIPNLNTLADLIDRLIVEVNKLSFFENMKREEHAKGEPNAEMIAHWDNLSRDCCEYRSMLKNEINRVLSNICKNGEYETLEELRTFRKPARKVSSLIADRCHQAAEEVRAELAEAFKNELG